MLSARYVLAITVTIVALLAGVGTPADGATQSEIVVHARGRLGTESMTVELNGVEIGRADAMATGFEAYRFPVPSDTVVTSLRVRADPGGWPQSVIVDKIKVDGQTFQAEAPGTQSKGSWTQATGCTKGFKRSEWLQCTNGWFEFNEAHGLALSGPQPALTAPTLIFDTDMGPDIDDALGLAMVHAYANAGDAALGAVTISRNSDVGAQYADLLNTFYGRPDVPIGVYRGSTVHDGAESFYTADIVGSGVYPFSLASPVPEAVDVIRQVLADSADNSVVIVQVGFSTNTAELLASEPDSISPLSGAELAAAKVRTLSIMGGRNGASQPEFNIEADIAAAQTVFADWPGEILQSDGNLGHNILYPYSSIQTDFGSVPDHPIPDSYTSTDLGWHDDEPPFYNMRAWDLTSVLAAVEPPETYFPVGPPGTVTVDAQGRTTFAASPNGLHRSLGVHSEMTPTEVDQVVGRMVELVSAAPVIDGPGQCN